MSPLGRPVGRPELGAVVRVLGGKEEPVSHRGEIQRDGKGRGQRGQQDWRAPGQGNTEEPEPVAGGESGGEIERAAEDAEVVHRVEREGAVGPLGRAVGLPDPGIVVEAREAEEDLAARLDGLVVEEQEAPAVDRRELPRAA